MKYKIKIKFSNKEEIINAKSELEAKVKFCKKNNLSYQLYANKLEITKI
jgi:hypothetical protein